MSIQNFNMKSFNCFILLLVMLIASCKTKPASNTQPLNANADEKPANNKQAPYPTEPGTCNIQGFIYFIFPIDKLNSEEPCKSFPCKARVVITKIKSCGFGVSSKPNPGDTLEVNFIHSLASSRDFIKVYPAKVILPGLKQDQLFEALMKIKILPMEKFSYEISSYSLLR